MNKDKRAAKFYINREVIENNPEIVKDLLCEVIIVRAELSYSLNAMEYIGIADFFPIHGQGCEIQEVYIVVHRDKDGYETWEFDTKEIK